MNRENRSKRAAPYAVEILAHVALALATGLAVSLVLAAGVLLFAA